MTVAALNRTIEFLREAQKAPAAQLASYAHGAESLPDVLASETDATAHMLAKSAVRLARQLIFVDRAALPALRCTLLMLSDVMQLHAQARGFKEKPASGPTRDEHTLSPYYLRD